MPQGENVFKFPRESTQFPQCELGYQRASKTLPPLSCETPLNLETVQVPPFQTITPSILVFQPPPPPPPIPPF